MTRKTYAPRLALGGLLAALTLACEFPEPPMRHVVLVTLDTVRADHLPFYDYPRPTAPFLSELAERSVVFDRAQAASSHTTPTHASLLTALYPYQHGALGNGSGLHPDVTTLALHLQEQGFTTAAFTGVRFLEVLDRGFQRFDAPERAQSGFFVRPGGDTVERAISWLEDRRSSERVFLWVHLFDAHEYSRHNPRYGAAKEALERESDLDEQAKRDLLESLHGVEEIHWRKRRLLPKMLEYDGRIRYLDFQVERLFDAFQEFDTNEPTLWVVTADHGEAFGDHNYVGHGKFLYEEQLRVPLLLHSTDGRLAPRREAELVRHIDLPPTILELVAYGQHPAAGGWEGVSLAARLRNSEQPRQARTSFAQRRPPLNANWRGRAATGGAWSISDGRYKLIAYSNALEELFDLSEDPEELQNLIASPPADALAIRTELAQRLRAAQEAEPVPLAEEYLEELRALGYVD